MPRGCNRELNVAEDVSDKRIPVAGGRGVWGAVSFWALYIGAIGRCAILLTTILQHHTHVCVLPGTPKMPTSPPSFLVRLCGVGRGCCPQQRGGARNGCILRPSTRDGLQSFPDLHRRRLPASCPGDPAATLHDVGCTDSLAAPHHRITAILHVCYHQATNSYDHVRLPCGA